MAGSAARRASRGALRPPDGRGNPFAHLISSPPGSALPGTLGLPKWLHLHEPVRRPGMCATQSLRPPRNASSLRGPLVPCTNAEDESPRGTFDGTWRRRANGQALAFWRRERPLNKTEMHRNHRARSSRNRAPFVSARQGRLMTSVAVVSRESSPPPRGQTVSRRTRCAPSGPVTQPLRALLPSRLPAPPRLTITERWPAQSDRFITRPLLRHLAAAASLHDRPTAIGSDSNRPRRKPSAVALHQLAPRLTARPAGDPVALGRDR